MIQALLPWVADALVLFGLAVLTVSVFGLVTMPDIYTRLHAASKAGLMGVIPILLVATFGAEPAAIPKAILIGGFLVLTTPIVAHEIGRAAYVERRRMSTPGSVDESGTEIEHRDDGSPSLAVDEAKRATDGSPVDAGAPRVG